YMPDVGDDSGGVEATRGGVGAPSCCGGVDDWGDVAFAVCVGSGTGAGGATFDGGPGSSDLGGAGSARGAFGASLGVSATLGVGGAGRGAGAGAAAAGVGGIGATLGAGGVGGAGDAAWRGGAGASGPTGREGLPRGAVSFGLSGAMSTRRDSPRLLIMRCSMLPPMIRSSPTST